jgi:hypothetical protein
MRRTWTLPAARAKNGRHHSLYVLTLPRNGIVPKMGHASLFEPISFSRMKDELDKLLPANMPPWTRRTAASGMAGLGVQPRVVEAVLNHLRGVASVRSKSAPRSTFGAPMLPRWSLALLTPG